MHLAWKYETNDKVFFNNKNKHVSYRHTLDYLNNEVLRVTKFFGNGTIEALMESVHSFHKPSYSIIFFVLGFVCQNWTNILLPMKIIIYLVCRVRRSNKEIILQKHKEAFILILLFFWLLKKNQITNLL